MHIAMLLYPNMTTLDFVGPYEVFSFIPDANVIPVARQPGVIRVDAGHHLFNADRTLDDVEQADIVFVPGSANNAHVLADESVLDWIRCVDAGSRWTTSVCTGSLILAAAGLLNGVRSTTHWAAMEALRSYGATPVRERTVTDGKYMTGAGVSAGIDLALILAEAVAGEAVARAIQLSIEYDPRPPFRAGSFADATDEMIEMSLGLLARRSRMALRT
ncbi:MAG: DJ-1/PfpI family protein [Acidimicrobiia bacterium]